MAKPCCTEATPQLASEWPTLFPCGLRLGRLKQSTEVRRSTSRSEKQHRFAHRPDLLGF